MNFLVIILALFFTLTSSVMLNTHLRRFWHPFRSIFDFKWYLQSRTDFMAFTDVVSIKYHLGLSLADNAEFPLVDAVNLLLESDDHTLIVCYKSPGLLKKGFREYGQRNKTPQIWSFFELTEGPRGMGVDIRTSREALNHDYTDNRILAVGWTYPRRITKNLRYNRSHIDEMNDRLSRSDRPDRLLVIVFDAVILSKTPEVIMWMEEPLCKLPVMIRLHNPALHASVNIQNLLHFINATEMWPYFFDLPVNIHYSLITNNSRFQNILPRDESGSAKISCMALMTLWLMGIQVIQVIGPYLSPLPLLQ